MLSASDGYRSAIVGDVRRMLLRAVLDIIDPDISYGAVSSNDISPLSQPAQLTDKDFTLTSLATLERNRWILDGRRKLVPSDGSTVHVGYLSYSITDEHVPSVFPWVEISFANVSILQACSVYFSTDPLDGVPSAFRVEVRREGEAVYTKEISGNMATHVDITGFTVHNPDAIRVTVLENLIPQRRARIIEIIPGTYEQWSEDIIASMDLQMRSTFSCLSIPYGTCTIRMDNIDRRFEPRNKSGVFQSIEERQAIPVSIGCELDDGSVEYKNVGVFFQANGGWKTGDNGISMQWDLVDIVGLLSSREFKAPTTLPTTLSGWMAALVSQLGANFAGWYRVDPNYADAAATINSAADVEGQKCGDILRWVCMATGTWPRADAGTGYLTAEPFWSQGNKLDLDNMSSYPVMRANDDLAVLTFKLFDSAGTVLNVSGNATSSSNTLTISNPFLHTQAQALTAARQILSQYGGIKLETVSRGDPASEIGDVDTVWLNESRATTGRRMEQRLGFSNGVLRDCRSVLLQADGSFMYQQRQVITESGIFTAQAGVKELRLILVGPGADGEAGTDGSWSSAGVDGSDGLGGKVYAITIDIDECQSFAVSISDTVTTFGAYSSADGKNYEYGYTDVASGDSFARSGVKAPLPGSGDGGAGGKGGAQGHRHTEKDYTVGGTLPGGNNEVYIPVDVIDNYPGTGTPGAAGATGCVVIYWDKEAAS